jgi:hypothetical protein
MKRLERLAASAWFAYGSILLIQAKVLWGIWQHRDLTSGDSSEYFVTASQWTHGLHLNPVYSPLYGLLWGSLRWVFDDPYTATILHRVLIVLAATLLVLAVLRRLLTPGIAWVLAVWWAILPVNYDSLYEVHLFALIFELAAVLIALSWSGLRMRAGVFTVLLATAVLVRSEVAIAVAIWAAAWIAYELRARARGEMAEPRRLLPAAGIPCLAVGLIAAAVIASSTHKDVGNGFAEKGKLNTCQIYAFGYQQRHDDFEGNPFLECGRLMTRDFGEARPTLTEAIGANPGAMASHFLWNARLAPYGIELMLFDRISAGQRRDPDYIPVKAGSAAALIASLLLATFVLAGLALLWRERRRWWESWIAPRAWGWVALGALGAMAVVVLLWQRPRPEYLFALSVLILAVVGMSAMAFVDRWPVLKRAGAAIPLVALLLLILVPAHYDSEYVTPGVGRPDRPIKAMVDRLYPVRGGLRGEDARLLATYPVDGCNYVGGDDPCSPVSWDAVLRRASAASAREALERERVDFIYVDEMDLEDPAIADAVHGARAAGWSRAEHSRPDDGWLLLRAPATPG